MVIQGKLKKDGGLAGRPYRLDIGLDSAYVQVSNGDPVYSDYVPLPDRGKFHDLIAIVDFDKHNQVVGFTIEGMLEIYGPHR